MMSAERDDWYHPTVESLTDLLARFVGYAIVLIFVAILLIMLLKVPTTRMQRASLGLIVAVNLMVFRAFYLRAVAPVYVPPPQLPQPLELVFLVVVAILSGNFLRAIWLTWVWPIARLYWRGPRLRIARSGTLFRKRG